jgi:hypothetical protein
MCARGVRVYLVCGRVRAREQAYLLRDLPVVPANPRKRTKSKSPSYLPRRALRSSESHRYIGVCQLDIALLASRSFCCSVLIVFQSHTNVFFFLSLNLFIFVRHIDRCQKLFYSPVGGKSTFGLNVNMPKTIFQSTPALETVIHCVFGGNK